MNTAIIFAGGSGQRMKITGKPKQFLKIENKPIIIHTLELFEKHPEINNIAVACIEEWIDYFKELVVKYELKKVKWIVPGGKTGQASIYNALHAVEQSQDLKETIVLVHDGVRPMITKELISECISGVKEYGSAITSKPCTETITKVNKETGDILEIPNRNELRLAQAPQAFYLRDLIDVHNRALTDSFIDAIDSASLMMRYGKRLHYIEGNDENIKITTPKDFYILKAFKEMEDSISVLGM